MYGQNVQKVQLERRGPRRENSGGPAGPQGHSYATGGQQDKLS